MTSTISSAVAVPELEDTPAPTLKRRLSTASNGDEKRARLSNDSAAAPVNEATGIPEITLRKKRTSADEERRRGKRLFGNLLGTLSQAPSATVQRRRGDIERKQQEKLKVQDAEDSEAQRVRYEEVLEQRMKQQVTYDEELMRLRHTNERYLAHFLQTTTLPKLYYLPWKLRDEERDRTQKQIEEVDVLVGKETEALPRAELKIDGEGTETDKVMGEADHVGEDDTRNATVEDVSDAAGEDGQGINADTGQEGHAQPEPQEDHESEVDGEEDPVIY